MELKLDIHGTVVAILIRGCFLFTFQSHADALKIVCPSLLGKDYLYAAIWREAIHSQKESLEEAILRMALKRKKYRAMRLWF